MSAARIIKDLKSANPSIRAEAALILGEGRIREAVVALIEALNDEEPSVQGRSAWALGEIGDSQALKPVLDCYLKFKKSWDRKNHRQSKFFTTYLYAIVKLMDFSQLVELFETGDQYEKVVALHTISQRNHPKSNHQLRKALEDEDDEVKRVASDLLAEIRESPDTQTSESRDH